MEEINEHVLTDYHVSCETTGIAVPTVNCLLQPRRGPLLSRRTISPAVTGVAL